MPDHCIDIKFPVFDHCAVLTRIPFLDDISSQHIFNYGRCRHFSPLESSIEEEKMALLLVSAININWLGELWCPLVVRVPFILGIDLAESNNTSTQSSPKYFSKPIMCQARSNQVSYLARTNHF